MNTTKALTCNVTPSPFGAQNAKSCTSASKESSTADLYPIAECLMFYANYHE